MLSSEAQPWHIDCTVNRYTQAGGFDVPLVDEHFTIPGQVHRTSVGIANKVYTILYVVPADALPFHQGDWWKGEAIMLRWTNSRYRRAGFINMRPREDKAHALQGIAE